MQITDDPKKAVEARSTLRPQPSTLNPQPSTLTVHLLRFEVRAIDPILLNEHKGSALRGALFNALRGRFCHNREVASCHPCPLHATCPICTLVATVDEGGQRGADPPRPFVIDPPLDQKTYYQPGDTLEFGLTLFGDGLKLFPYVVVAFQEAGNQGTGKRVASGNARPQRGRFAIEKIEAVNPLTGERQPVKTKGDDLIRLPNVPLTFSRVEGGGWRVEGAPSTLSPQTLTLRFLTPVRLIDNGRLVRPLRFRPLVQRLFERLTGLMAYYAGAQLEEDFAGLLALAEEVPVVEDRMRWVELDSYSARQHRATPMGGLVGEISFAGELGPFLPYLIWGQFTHVGKDATKGNGWYRVEGGGYRVEG
ncbi:MAG: CRISPR system precrRNA processing endoribonuclease RAMP protein Cas6 [Chloroflexi bacterium]|nr:CRISPR system precrRNA processing endoribonuclease RAMP protein Cas6 [Chloroflexota bacterium]